MVPTLLKRLPGYSAFYRLGYRHFSRFGTNPFLQFVPPGHFYSVIPDMKEVDARAKTLFHEPAACIGGVDTNDAEQLRLVGEWRDLQTDAVRYFAEADQGNARYTTRGNAYFNTTDALVLQCILRRFRSRRFVEVGSGFSSAVVLDTADRFLHRDVTCTFIDPEPGRLLSVISSRDRERHRIFTKQVQDVPVEFFGELSSEDILFIDSSHVVKIGSDVNWLLTRVLPTLQTGVLVHFHDIVWPFENPEAWIREGRTWNECYFLRAFLQYNSAFRILFFTSYLACLHAAQLEQSMPLALMVPGQSLWLRKTV